MKGSSPENYTVHFSFFLGKIVVSQNEVPAKVITTLRVLFDGETPFYASIFAIFTFLAYRSRTLFNPYFRFLKL